MSLAHGRPFLAIPGPSVFPESVLQAMNRPEVNIYEGELVDMAFSMREDLCKVARTDGNVAYYIANGHGAWEAAIANTLSAGDHALVLATGRFGKGWALMAEALGVKVEMMDFGNATPNDLAQVEARLRADTDHRIKAVLSVHTDTSTSLRNDIPGLRAALDAAKHPALLQVDCIASLACEPFEMDAWGVDVMVTGCQKGLMTPPGLAFVYFNARADQVRNAMPRVSSYWDWRTRTRPELFYQLFCGTAPTHHLYGLRAALDLIMAEGIEAVWQRHTRMASAVWCAVETWGEGNALALNVTNPKHRSTAVTTIRTEGDIASRLRKWCETEASLTLGIGLGIDDARAQNAGELFRIGHMGYLNPPMLMGTLGTIETGLKALGIPHGKGGLERAAEALVA
ncbi:MAG: aminotransferase class V-fold PLP-dependent enzyme [Pseudomonadota bacterium]